MERLEGGDDSPIMDASSSTASLYPPPFGNQRKERGAIAAQACDTCRSRKQKCDEQRPCGTCQKFGLECNYREPQPTKKDKTLVEILDRIRSLEDKIDSLHLHGSFPSAAAYDPVHASILSSATPLAAVPGHGHFGPHLPSSSFHVPEAPNVAPFPEGQYKYISSAHQVLGWPAMQQLLLESIGSRTPYLDSSMIQREGLSAILGLDDREHALPADINLKTYGPAAPLGHGGSAKSSAGFIARGLDWETMRRLSNAYFDSVNLLYPLLDRRFFTSETLPSIYQNGFDDGVTSTLAFLVFALGEVAISDSQGPPIQVYNNRPSGVKGGSIHQPPGLALFNEARKRMGFNLTECSLENVQIFVLASLYYETCFHHMEFWRMTTSASLACQALIRSNPAELSSPRAYLIKRAFWHCCIMETCLNLELGLSLTGLDKLEAVVGIPDFTETFLEDSSLGDHRSLFRECFASQIVLRRLLVDFHNTLSQASVLAPLPGSPGVIFPAVLPTAPVNQTTISQLAAQLEQWRGMLPPPLRWQEDSRGAFSESSSDPYSSASVYSPATPQPIPPTGPITIPIAATAAGPSSSQPSISTLVFTTDLDTPPVTYPFVLDIQAALLRSRYYHAKHLVHRPFIYKALHHPDALTSEDAAGVVTCLRAGLKWPVALSPACTRKRLIPCTFFWSQNLLGVLLLLRLSETHPALRQVRESLCGERFEMEARETVGLYIDWLRDLKGVDSAARWCWSIVRAVYGLED